MRHALLLLLRRNMALAVFFLCSWSMLSDALCAACPRLDPAGLDRLRNDRTEPLKIIFFASWCSSCREHLLAPHTANTILIGSFDKQERIEKAVRELGLKTECYFDAGVTDHLKINSLPAQVVLPPLKSTKEQRG